MQLIYRLMSPSGKVYIGQTKRLASRMSCYRNGRCKSQALLYGSIRKHGFSQHEFHVIHKFPELVNQKVVDDYEKYAIHMHKHVFRAQMLNLTEGGRGNGHRRPQPRSVLRPDVQGEKHALAKLSDEHVRDIRAIYMRGVRWRGIRQLSRYYNVSQKLIFNIVNVRTRKSAGTHGRDSQRHIPHVLADIETKGRLAQAVNAYYYPPRKRRCESYCEDTACRCKNNALHDSDFCGLHTLSFRENQRVKSLANPRPRTALGQWGVGAK